MAVQTKIQFRRDTAANWTTANPVLGGGELGFETDTTKFKIGDGTTAWASLNYYVSSASPAFTGAVTATSFNSITGLSSTNPSALGAVAVGTGTTTARADHVHPTTGLGLTSGTLGQFAATTSAQLLGVISDETGTGSLVFAASPTFTGTPLSTTAAVDTNTTQIATTAYVVGQGYAKLVSPTFSGTPTLPTGTIATTQTAGNSTTAIATTAFVTNAITLNWTTAQVTRSITSAGDTPTAADAGKLLLIDTSTGAVTIAIAATLDLAVGQRIDFLWLGAATSVLFTTSATLNGTPGLKLRARYSAATVLCVATDSYVLLGDLSA